MRVNVSNGLNMKLVVEQEMFHRSELATDSHGNKCLLQVLPRYEAIKGHFFTSKLNSGVAEVIVEELTPQLKALHRDGNFVLYIYRLTDSALEHFEIGNDVIYLYRVIDVL